MRLQFGLLAASLLAVGCSGSGSGSSTTSTSSGGTTGNTTATTSTSTSTGSSGSHTTATTASGTTNPTTSTSSGTTNPASSSSSGTTHANSSSSTSSGTTNPASSSSSGTSNPTTSTSSSSSGSGTAGCGSVTGPGDCQGSVVEFCYPGDLPDAGTGVISYDCSTQLSPDAGETLTCGVVDAAYGVDCLAPSGGNCLLQGSTGQFVAFCAGTNSGCVLGASTALCQTVPNCTSFQDDGGFVFSGAAPNLTACSSNLLQVQCNVNQVVADDCAGVGGACADVDGGAICDNLPAGAGCDGVTFVCASGHTCTADAGMGFLNCQ